MGDVERQRSIDLLNARLLLLAELIALIESHERPDPERIRALVEDERRTIESLRWGVK